MILMRSYTKNDSGSNVLIEYLFTIIISTILFAMLLLSLQSVLAKSDQLIMSEEIDIASSIVANQLSDFSNGLWLNDYTGTYSLADSAGGERYFSIPEPYGDKQYSIEVSDEVIDANNRRGKVKVTFQSDPDVYSIFTFNTPYPVQHGKITCNTYNLKVSLKGSGASKYITLEEV